MGTDTLRQRHATTTSPTTNSTTPPDSEEVAEHPGGKIKHGAWTQALRMCLFAAYFNGSIMACVPPSLTNKFTILTTPASS